MQLPSSSNLKTPIERILQLCVLSATAGVSCGPVRVRCELRGPEPAVRVRQVRVLSAPAPLPAPPAPPAPAHILHALTEADTLRVFRLLTSQVYTYIPTYFYNNNFICIRSRQLTVLPDCALIPQMYCRKIIIAWTRRPYFITALSQLSIRRHHYNGRF